MFTWISLIWDMKARLELSTFSIRGRDVEPVKKMI